MIQSKKDLKEYLLADKHANKFYGFSGYLDLIRKYLNRLRKTEYLLNCHKSKIRLNLSKYFLYKLSLKTGISIGLNVFGKGLYVPHHGCIVVNSNAKFGDNCVIQCGVNVSEGVIGGNHCYLGAGSKLMIGARIGNDVIVGANSVVTKVFEEDNVVLAGVPARIISNKGFASNRDSI